MTEMFLEGIPLKTNNYINKKIFIENFLGLKSPMVSLLVMLIKCSFRVRRYVHR